jgi:AAA15 family ATPase/GTPase
MKMENKHLIYFKVENFKRFESLEVNDIGHFNLIVGDNNVGKTSLLEALLVRSDGDRFLRELFYILTFIKKFDRIDDKFGYFLDYFLKNKNIEEGNQLLFQTNDKDGTNNFLLVKEKNKLPDERKWVFNSESSEVDISESRLDLKSTKLNLNIPFIPLGFSYDHDISAYYSNYIQKQPLKKEKFLEELKKIVPLITNIEVSALYQEPILLLSQKGVDSLLPLATFGDGFLKLFRLLISIVIQSGKRLMIDEIDTGVHYSRIKDFWKMLIQSSIDNNVQLFATTHSKECLQSYQEALEELGYQEKGRIIRLVEHSNSQVKAYTYTYEQFGQSLDNDNEIR